jgi:hypothetical protein
MNGTKFENHNIRLGNTRRAKVSIRASLTLRQILQDPSRPRDAELKTRLVGTDDACGRVAGPSVA